MSTMGATYPAVLFTVFEGNAGSTRCTPASWPPRCSTRPRRERPILLRREAEVGTWARAVSRHVELYADQLAFFAHELSR